MAGRVTRAFFYGLFMDADLLRGQGLHPNVIGPASLRGYELRIGERASLVPNVQSIAYGMLIELPEDELATLYGAPTVRDYVAETVVVRTLGDDTPVPSVCYNLPAEKIGANRNTDYARQLAALVRALGLPERYAADIARHTEGGTS